MKAHPDNKSRGHAHYKNAHGFYAFINIILNAIYMQVPNNFPAQLTIDPVLPAVKIFLRQLYQLILIPN